MDYEKKYKEALELARVAAFNGHQSLMEGIFPELAESEDEKTRKRIFALVNAHGQGMYKDDMLDWLEKQGEQKPIIEMKSAEESLGISSEEYNDIVNECLYGESKAAEWKQENVEELSEFENAMMHIGYSFFGKRGGLDPNDTSSVKVQAQYLLELAQKPAWSEEDECYMGECIGAIATKDGWSFEEKRKTKHWLKSMKERCSWNPSDEQITVLELASKYERVFTPKQIDILIGLKEQLKKLKGE